MSPHEKAVHAINFRLERLQVNLRAASDEVEQRLLVQAIVVLIGLSEALDDYVTKVGAQVRRRQAEMKQAGEEFAARHAAQLQSGEELLARFKASPGDRALRKELDDARRAMEATQKQVRRLADGVQKELAPPIAMIDAVALTVRRLVEAEQADGLKRALKAILQQVNELYAANRALPRGLVPAAAWEEAAAAGVDQGASSLDAFARAAYQAILALEWMALSVAEQPPAAAEEAAKRAEESAAARVKVIAARFAQGEAGKGES